MSPIMRRTAAAAVVLILTIALSACGGDPVPEITGQRYEAAEFLLQQAGFRVGRVSYDADADGPPGYIVRQYPRADSLATPGDDVDITIAGPHLVVVPMLVGDDADDARSALKDADLRRGRRLEEYNSYIPEGVVIDQDPRPGTRAPEGTKVEYTVSLGPERGQVPGVTGEWEGDARSFLLDLGFRSGVDREHSREPQGVVIDQQPGPRAEIVLGDRVDLTISMGPELVKVPDVRGLDVSDATGELRSAGMEVQVKESAVLREKAQGVVYSQQPIGGFPAAPGTPVTLYVSSP